MQFNKPIWVESESNKIGKLSIPKNLFKRMIVGNILKLNIPLNERANFILKDYDYFVNKISLIKNSMIFLKKFLTNNEFLDLEKNLSSKQYDIFVKNLLKFHYDKLYKKRTYYPKENEIEEVKIDSVNIKNSEKILKEMNKKHWK